LKVKRQTNLSSPRYCDITNITYFDYRCKRLRFYLILDVIFFEVTDLGYHAIH